MKTFEELGVAAPILKAIQELGYVSPMPVQEEVIPYLLGQDNDVIALAQTGTGKTAAFGLPILQKIEVEDYQPQALVLCPTRELCLQIADDLNDYSKYIDHLRVLPVYGGSSIESQIKTLKRGVHVVVATPGRLLDLMNRKTVDLSHIRNVIMDEADEMLNMGFTDSINAILAEVPVSRNMLLFSATMPQGIAAITKQYMNHPKEIVIGNKNEGNKNIRDIYFMVRAQDKYLALKRIADFYPNIYAIIFCRTRKETQEIADIYKTEVCPLAKAMRKRLRQEGITDVKVVYSREEPVVKSTPPGSISFVPGAAGLLMAGEVTRSILIAKGKKNE